MKLHSLYIADRKDEIETLQWVTRIIKWVLDQAIDRQQLGIDKVRLELEDTKKFDNLLHDKIQELEIELEDSNTDKEKEIIVNQIDILKCANDNLHQVKQQIKIQDVESKISELIQN